MKTILAVTAITMLAVASYAAGNSTEKPAYKIFRLTRNELAVACTNGGDPAVATKLTGADALIISCGE